MLTEWEIKYVTIKNEDLLSTITVIGSDLQRNQRTISNINSKRWTDATSFLGSTGTGDISVINEK